MRKWCVLFGMALGRPGSLAKVASRVAVVGAGVGGLVCSTNLARAGLDVTLFEKHEQCGGRLQSEMVGDYRFDVGPSLLLLPDVYKNTFASLGGDIADYTRLVEVADPLYRVYFEDDEQPVDVRRKDDSEGWTASFEKLAPGRGQDMFTAYKGYLRTASSFLKFGWPAVIEERPLQNLDKLPSFLLACLRSWPLSTQIDMLQSFFGRDEKKIHALLSFQTLYVGLAPGETPAVFSLLQALELEKGIFYPQGGFGRVAQGLKSLAERAGVKIRLNESVSAVRVRSVGEENSAKGLDTPSSHLPFDQVVLNVDVPFAEDTLVPEASLRDDGAIASRPSCGVVSLSLGLSRRLDALAHHTLFLSGADEAASWASVTQPDTSSFNPDAFNFYVHAPERTDPTCCPPGQDAITVLVPVPPLPRGQGRSEEDDQVLVDQVRLAVFKRLAPVCGDVESFIVCESTRSPITWKDEFGLFRGQVFGLAHSLQQLSLLRPRFRHPKVRGLWRTGASTRPGNGVPLTMVSGKLASDAILDSLHIR